jgi:hypothetical protein
MKGKTMNTIKLYAVLPLVIFATSGLAQQPATQTFPSTAEASQSLFQAVQRNDEPAIQNILGGTTDLTSSSDEAQDKVEREMFVEKYKEMHRLSRDPDGSVTLYIGAENWPFPIPLVQKSGVWHFDADAGRKEIMFRRIGENEMSAIVMCHEFVASEKNYSKNPSADDPTGISPISLAAKAATGSTGGDPIRLHGYYFHVVSTRPGAFALIAYPAAYRSTGVMTFVVTENGVVYEKDLGPDTSTTAAGLTTFHKDGTWVASSE